MIIHGNWIRAEEQKKAPTVSSPSIHPEGLLTDGEALHETVRSAFKE